MSGRWLTIVGIGEDGADGLSAAARRAVAQAALVVGGARHLTLADGLIAGERMTWPSPMAAAYPMIAARRGTPTVVLASGDPYCHGIGGVLAEWVPAAETLCHPGVSAFALARARLGWAAQAVAEMSLCGHPVAGLVRQLRPGARVLALSADETTPGLIAALLCRHGFGASRVHVLEALGGVRERVRCAGAEGFALDGVQRLNLVGLELAGGVAVPLASGLPDALFEHDGQFSRREMRAITLSSLAPCPGEMLWDVGAGSGSVGIEWLLRHPANRAVAVERHAGRLERLVANAARLGVPGLHVVAGEAPAALEGLPGPDAVFLGGGAHAAGVIATAWSALRPGGRLVANAVTLETEAALLAAQGRLGGTLLRVGLERSDRVGTMQAFRPAMTVTQFLATKP